MMKQNPGNAAVDPRAQAALALWVVSPLPITGPTTSSSTATLPWRFPGKNDFFCFVFVSSFYRNVFLVAYVPQPCQRMPQWRGISPLPYNIHVIRCTISNGPTGGCLPVAYPHPPATASFSELEFMPRSRARGYFKKIPGSSSFTIHLAAHLEIT
ncbi:hypothetical protein BDV26DRAFT_46725 [Aspergillus bertholletiae]|uniref:Uncharacterized protein n=1 Tax=Aspergillus bertholletiae TaxID=1226010 RepID=A0A5N7AWN5_9EURO|nr:hypothetical protein BDV26DRAFT_46725 [Aspergillus bertholletiae]